MCSALKNFFPSFSWSLLPEGIRAPLLQGGVGNSHVFDTVHKVFQAMHASPDSQESQRLLALGQDMLLSVWEQAFLETNPAALLLDVQQSHPFLTPPLSHFLKQCAQQAGQEAHIKKRFDPEVARHEPDYAELLLRQARKYPGSFFVANQVVRYGMREFLLDWVEAFIHSQQTLPEAFSQSLLADVAFAREDWDKAVHGYEAACTLLPLHIWRTKQAECLFRQGTETAQSKALELWRQCHKQRPWQVNTLLRLSDILQGRHLGDQGAFPPGQGAVLLYTWNKCQDMDDTLTALSRTELQGNDAPVCLYVLDNGSTDGTAHMLRSWQERFAQEHGLTMEILTMPINMGAPAARNYLLSLPSVRHMDWVAFLDDDVVMPPHWLRQLWAGTQAYPDSGVAAGHAVNFDAPLAQQWTDMHLTPLILEDNDWTEKGERFRFSSLHKQSLDYGAFTFMRPCVTVIGCCHFFTRQALDTAGLFDLRFSPSQSDDVDHDMRRALKSHLPVYNGHLRILHKRNTGHDTGKNLRAKGSALGNWFKLQVAYSPEEIMQIYQLDQQSMLQDVQARLKLL